MQTKIANFISGGAVDEAKLILAFEKTNPSTTDRIIFNTGVSLSNATNETFGTRGISGWGNNTW